MTKPQNNIDKPIQRHLQSRNHREQRIWKLRDGQFYTELDGYEITEDEYNDLFPPFNPISFLLDPNNVDKTHNFLI